MLRDKYRQLLIVLFFFLSFIVNSFFHKSDSELYSRFSKTDAEISKAFINRDYEQAQIISQNAVADAQSRKDNLETIIFLGDLARACELGNKADLAEETHKNRIKLIEDKALENQYPRVYYEAAAFYYDQKRCSEAREISQKYLNWQKFADGKDNSPDYCLRKSILNDSEQRNCS